MRPAILRVRTIAGATWFANIRAVQGPLNLSIPDYQTLMLPLLKRGALGEIRILEAEKQLADEFGLTPAERDQLLPSGKQRVLHNRAHWGKILHDESRPC